MNANAKEFYVFDLDRFQVVSEPMPYDECERWLINNVRDEYMDSYEIREFVGAA